MDVAPAGASLTGKAVAVAERVWRGTTNVRWRCRCGRQRGVDLLAVLCRNRDKRVACTHPHGETLRRLTARMMAGVQFL
ncbi:UNVERIFIED_ORG: hypothetical protein ABIB63_001039 [Xanthomonas axonopodis]